MTELISRDHIEQRGNVPISNNMRVMIKIVVVRCIAGYHKYAMCVSLVSDTCSVRMFNIRRTAIEESAPSPISSRRPTSAPLHELRSDAAAIYDLIHAMPTSLAFALRTAGLGMHELNSNAVLCVSCAVCHAGCRV